LTSTFTVKRTTFGAHGKTLHGARDVRTNSDSLILVASHTHPRSPGFASDAAGVTNRNDSAS
jgi:hypothetical protein